MNWRPENWENPYGMGKPVTKYLPSICDTAEEFFFEAGADAMLEALRTWHTGDIGTKWRIETIRAVQISFPFPKDTRGWLVLIPDREGG